jgi:methionyl-tRNA formyltransferase
MGTPRFGVLVLRRLLTEHEVVAVVTQPDRRAGRGRRTSIPPVKAEAESHGALILQPIRARDDAFTEQLRTLDPQMIIVAAFGQILPPVILALPEYGAINVHASLLPRHRGAAPIPAAILAGDKQTGVTIMLMDEGLDTGPVLSQASLPIESQDTTGTLTEKLGQLGAQLLVRTVPGWIGGHIAPRPQLDSAATYAGMLRREDAQIDWTEPADRIGRQVRAYYPWPIAFTWWGDKVLRILRGQPQRAEGLQSPAGRVVRHGDAIAVAAGNGVLLLDEVQLQGRRAMPAEEFVRGQRGFIGSTLTGVPVSTSPKAQQEKTAQNMHEASLLVQHKVGLHARPATLFVQTAKKYKSTIVAGKDGRQVNAKSILSILTLGARQGATITVKAEGEDAEQAVKALRNLVETNFGDPVA